MCISACVYSIHGICCLEPSLLCILICIYTYSWWHRLGFSYPCSSWNLRGMYITIHIQVHVSVILLYIYLERYRRPVTQAPRQIPSRRDHHPPRVQRQGSVSGIRVRIMTDIVDIYFEVCLQSIPVYFLCEYTLIYMSVCRYMCRYIGIYTVYLFIHLF